MFKRAWLSISRKRSKTIILGVLMFVIANLVLATIFIKNATNESIQYAKKSLGGEVYLQPDMDKLMENSNKEISNSGGMTGSMSSFERPNIYLDTVNKIADSTYIKDYTYSLSANGNAVSFSPTENTNNNFHFGSISGNQDNSSNVQIEGINAYAYIDGVKNKSIEITDGTYFDEKTDNKVIISYELATKNSLKINDKITIKNAFTNEEISLEIIGIYTETELENGRGFNSANRIYTNTKTASKFLSTDDYNGGNYNVSNVTYYLNNPEDADKFISEANKKVTTLANDNLTLAINNDAYETMIGPIESVGSFATTILIIVVIASIVIISLLINNQIKDRKYEMGVLMSLGETKKNIVIQVFLELLIISTCSFILSMGSSIFIADKMANNLLENQIKMADEKTNNNFGRPNFKGNISNKNNVETINEINVVAKVSDYGMLFGFGFIIIFGSMIIPTINIMRYEPKTILTRRD